MTERSSSSGARPTLFVIVASTGRADTLAQTIDRLADQTRKPDNVLVSATGADDVRGLDRLRVRPEILLTDKGLCRQRNAALDVVMPRADIIAFFDDDFVPAHDYLEQAERVLVERPGVVGVTGELVDDGIRSDPIPFAEAVRRLDEAGERPLTGWRRRKALYGCNMVMSVDAMRGLRFDEALPLYGWQEDIDFTYRLGQRGEMLSGPAITGIHMGVRAGRSSGKRLGYSQVANLVHLWRKGTMQPGLGQKLLFQNLASNLVRSLWPEPHIDRRGRLVGNILALADLARGRIDPRRIERL